MATHWVGYIKVMQLNVKLKQTLLTETFCLGIKESKIIKVGNIRFLS